MLKTKDNRFGDAAKEISKDQYDTLEPFSNRSLNDLKKENENLLVFPEETVESLEKATMFRVAKKNNRFWLETFNVLGVFEVAGEVKVEIHSRFDESDEQFFLSFLLSKAFEGNFINPKIGIKYGMWEIILVLLFYPFLLKAFRQGLFKEYQWFLYNKSNFKGQLHVSEQIRKNIPFKGEIAFRARENTFDNRILHLIRSTLNNIKRRFPQLFSSYGCPEFGRACQAIISETPSWRLKKQEEIIKSSHFLVKHPYFREYEPLRKICLQILQRQGASVFSTESKNQVEGIVFDGAWLWEKYLAKLLGPLEFKHHQFQKDGIKVFNKKDKKLYPDFLNKNSSVVLDAKYKKINNDIDREDIHQVLSYMYLTNAKIGGLIYPLSKASNRKEFLEWNIKEKENVWVNIGLPIPQKMENERLFLEEMKNSEKMVKEKIQSILSSM